MEVELCGWMYMDDDGYGPHFTLSERYAKRYLASWPVYRKKRGHSECDEGLAYGICRGCEAEKLYLHRS